LQTIQPINLGWMIAFLPSTDMYHFDRLRSTRRAKKVTRNKVTKAMETILGFC